LKENLEIFLMSVIYLDIETSDLKGSTILQIGAISDKNKIFNAFCSTQDKISATCTKLTGFFIYKGRLFLHGKEVDTIHISKALTSFFDCVDQNNHKPIYLIGHNSYAFDFRILIRHCLTNEITINSDIRFCDSLYVLKNIYEEKIENYQLGTLAKYFKIENFYAHSALADSVTLKRIVELVALESNKPIIDIFCTKFKNGKEF
jgi:DNA polymerase III alpha subunit (gram-positive type)